MLGIIIVNYRSEDLTISYVRDQLSRISIPFHVVVVDNGGSAESEARLKSGIPGVTVITAENKGYACGCNLGVEWLLEHVQPEYILFSNNDIQFQSDQVVESLCSILASREEVAAIGPEIVGNDGKRQSPEPYRGLWNRYVWMYVSTPFLSRERKLTLFQLDYAEKASEGYHYKLMGSFLMVRTKDFLRAGCFDEHTFLFAEEPILSERLLAIGKRCYFYPAVAVLHDHGKVIRSSFAQKEIMLLQFRSMAYYYRNYKGYPAWEVSLVSFLFRFILLLK